MNRATILLETVPTELRCQEIARRIAAEHFKQENPAWEIVYKLPDNTPLHLRDQFEAEIREQKLKRPAFLLVYGPTLAADGEK